MTKTSPICRIITILCILLPIYGQYAIVKATYGIGDIILTIILCYIIIIYAINKKKLIIHNKLYVCFILWTLISTFVLGRLLYSYYSMQTFYSSIQDLIGGLIIILISKEIFDYKYGISLYVKTSVFLSLLVWVQIINYQLFNNSKIWMINNDFIIKKYVLQDIGSIFDGKYRAASLFSEPAMYAAYVGISIAFLLFYQPFKKNNYFIAVFISISILATGSTGGMAYIFAIWGYWIYITYFVNVKREKSISKSKIVIGILLFIFLLMILLIGGNSIDIFNRLLEIQDASLISSGSNRIVRGWKIYGSMNILEKIIGIGTMNTTRYLTSHPNIVPIFRVAYNGYMSGASNIFVQYGLIGGTLLILWILSILKKGTNTDRGIVAFLIMYLLGTSGYNSYVYILSIIFISISICGKSNIISTT